MDTSISNRILEKYPNYKSFFEPIESVKKFSVASYSTWFTKDNIAYCIKLSIVLSLLYVLLTLPFTFMVVGKSLSKVGLGDLNVHELRSNKNVLIHSFVFFIISYFILLSQKLV